MKEDHFSIVRKNKVYDIYASKIVRINYNELEPERRRVVRLTQKEFEDLKVLYISHGENGLVEKVEELFKLEPEFKKYSNKNSLISNL